MRNQVRETRSLSHCHHHFRNAPDEANEHVRVRLAENMAISENVATAILKNASIVKARIRPFASLWPLITVRLDWNRHISEGIAKGPISDLFGCAP